MEYQCTEGPCGVSVGEAKKRLKGVGPNKISPSVKENRWLKLFRITFMAGFNILLWACVAAEVAMIFLLSENLSKVGVKDWITPIILSIVIVSAAFLQWWSEEKAEAMMDSLAAMASAELVPTVRYRTGVAGGRNNRGDDEYENENNQDGDAGFR